MLAEGPDMTEVLPHLEIVESTWNRWRSMYGGVKAGAARRLQELEAKNAK